MDRQLQGWLLEGDPAIQWQVGRDLLGWKTERAAAVRNQVVTEGWGAHLLALQDPSGTWAGGIYSPKWTSTTYTLLLLRHLGVPAGHPGVVKGLELLFDLVDDRGEFMFATGGTVSDICVNGMVLALASSFVPGDPRSDLMAARLVSLQMADGGWNCQPDTVHSSFHTTMGVLEGLLEYQQAGGALGSDVAKARRGGEDFFICHQLYKSHRTGEPINKSFTMLSFPPRWFFDILRGLDYLQAADAARDPAYQSAVEILLRKRRADGTWPVQHFHSGRVFFHMEETGRPSRWNTLRALRVLRWWEADY